MRGQRSQRAFVLLEVLLSIVIIAVALVAIMKGFIISLDSIKRIRLNEKAIVLGRSLLDDLILEPPDEGRFKGTFASDSRFGPEYEGWSWEMDVEAEEPDYEERPRGRLTQDLEQVYTAQIKIIHESETEKKTYLDLYTILMDPDIYSQTAIQGNQLF